MPEPEKEPNGFKSKLEIARHLLFAGFEDKNFVARYKELISQPANAELPFSVSPILDQQDLYRSLCANGLQDGTRAFTHVFMSMSGLPLKKQ